LNILFKLLPFCKAFSILFYPSYLPPSKYVNSILIFLPDFLSRLLVVITL